MTTNTCEARALKPHTCTRVWGHGGKHEDNYGYQWEGPAVRTLLTNDDESLLDEAAAALLDDTMFDAEYREQLAGFLRGLMSRSTEQETP